MTQRLPPAACVVWVALAAAAPTASPDSAAAQQAMSQPPAVPALGRADTLRHAEYAAAFAGLPPHTRAELTALVDGARASGLPAAALERKVVEGVAKQADPARIVTVVRNVELGLRAAQATLGLASADELVAAGAAVQAGVAPEQLRRLRAGLPRGRSITQAVVVLTDLARRGVAPGDGARAIIRLARAGAGDADLGQWRAEVAADVAAGVGAPAAAVRRADTFLRARGALNAPVVTPTPNPLDP